MHQIFVYGTLKRGFPNHLPWMETMRFRGLYRTLEAFPLVIGGRWFTVNLLPEPGIGFQVTGELYEADDAGLELLDQLESIHLPTGYRRQKISLVRVEEDPNTAFDAGAAVEAWAYFKDRTMIETIHDGPMEQYLVDPRYIPISQRT